MGKITAADVKKLRDLTGAGMMDCKKALAESEGDIQGAIEYLRKKGQKMTEKRADRAANEGVVIALTSEDQKRGIVVKLACETDFVAKNEDFVAFAKEIAEIALTAFPADKEALLALNFNDSITIGDKVIEKTGVIGEKVEVSVFESIESELVVPYIHAGYRAGVIVALNKTDESFVAPAKDVAMQVAAMKPIAVSEADVSEETKQKEMEIGKELARNEGKPEAMLEKIAMGRLNKFFKETTLLKQSFVKDNKKSVAQYLQTFDKELTVTGFRHVTLG